MKLLIFTQKVDSSDTTLGFFHTWIRELARRSKSVEVICLEKGVFNLPKNVTVYSLGKELGISRLGYLKNFYHYLFLISGSYDRVFVHMNQEYILFAGLYWRLKGIPVYLWRNHPHGSILTGLVVLLSTKVFCTSKASFTARFKKTIIMPAGIDTAKFMRVDGVVRKKYSVCMVGRIAPIKHVDLALLAIKEMISSGTQVSLNIIGSALPKDLGYYNALLKYVEDNKISTSVSFMEAVSPDRLPEIYSSYEVCLNLTDSGSFDKTIVESSSCGAIPLVSNSSLAGLLPEVCITKDWPEAIAVSLRRVLDAHQQLELHEELQSFVKSQSLSALMEKLNEEFIK